jgi:hypothetical protein
VRLDGSADVQVFDAAGRIVAVEPVVAGRGQLDVAGLPTGVYLVKATGQAAAAKLVVRR